MAVSKGLTLEAESSGSQTPWCPSYERISSGADTSGQDFEVAISSLLFLRALRMTRKFFLATNHSKAGKFDDAVLLYQLPGEGDGKYRAILLQAKHKKNATITPSMLRAKPKKDAATTPGTPSKSNKDFCLDFYMESFSEIKENWIPVVDVDGQRLEVEDVTPVLYSNAACKFDCSTLEVSDCTEPRHLLDILDTGGRVLKVTGETSPQRTDFFDRFVLCLEQMNLSAVDDFLAEELKKVLKTVSTDASQRLVSELKRLVKNWWWTKGTARYLTRDSEEWAKVLAEEMRRLNAETTNVSRELGLNFSRAILQDLDTSIRREGLRWILVEDGSEAAMTRAKLAEASTASLVLDVSTLEENLEEIEVMLTTAVCHTVVVDAAAGLPEEATLIRLRNAVRCHPGKHLVVVAKENPSDSDWRVTEAGSTWPDLDPECQRNLLSARVLFQGKEVALREILSDDVPDEVIATLRRSKTNVEVGRSLPPPPPYYVCRQLRRKTEESFDPFEWDPDEKILVVDGVPGVGKSSFVTWACSQAKDRFPGAWVIRVDVGHHTKLINETDFSDVGNVKKFLREASLGSCSRLEHFLLDHSLDVAGNVFLFVDGFDEISPLYTEKCCRLLAQISRNVKFRKLMVTTRPVTKKEVEIALRTDAVYLPLFSREDQNAFIVKFFEANGNTLDASALHSLRQSAHSILEIPLLCRMAAQVLSANFDERWHKARSPWRTVLLYRQFTEQSIMERLREKSSMDMSNTLVVNACKTVVDFNLRSLQELAVKKLFSADELPSAVAFSTNPPDDKLGLVVKRGENLDFEHKTFAEFFAGVWLSQHWKSFPADVLRKKLYEEDNRVATVTLNYMLFEGNPLHMAVACGDASSVQELLALRTAERQDCGGRNSFHVAATTEGPSREIWEELLTWGEDPQQEDLVCGWSVMSYAKSEGNLDMIEFLLDREVPIGDLYFISEEEVAIKILKQTLERDLVNLLHCIWPEYHDRIIFRYMLMGKTPLHIAARENSVHVVETLVINNCYNVDVKDDKGRTPLHESVVNGHWETTVLLLDLGADRENKDVAGNSVLLMAAMQDNLQIMKLLLEIGVDLHDQDDAGFTVFQVAAMEGHLEAVRLLLEFGVDPNITGTHPVTPIGLAALYGRLEMVRILLEHRAAFTFGDETCVTPLHMAAMKGHMEVAKLLLEHGIGPNIKDSEGHSALFIAVIQEHLEFARLLLESGSDPNVKDVLGMPVLYLPALEGNLDTVDVLLTNGADPNIKNDNGRTALHGATVDGHPEIVKKLLQHGANANIKDNFGTSALHAAAMKGFHRIVKLLLQHSGDPNIKDGEGRSALHVSAMGGHLKTLKLILEHALLDSNMVDDKGRTALHLAAMGGHSLTVALLLRHGVVSNVVDNDGRTELLFAAIEGHPGVVKKLLQHGANAIIKDNFGTSALLAAAMKGFHHIVKLLLQQTGDPNIKDGEGRSVLHVSAMGGHLKTVKEILEHAALDLNMVDDKGRTALHLAAMGNHYPTVKLLLHHGVDTNVVDCDERKALHLAVMGGCSETEVLLLDCSMEVNHGD